MARVGQRRRRPGRQPWPGRNVGRRRGGDAARWPGPAGFADFGRAVRRAPPQLGHRRRRAGTAAAVAAGRLRARHRDLLHRRARADVVGGAGACAASALRSPSLARRRPIGFPLALGAAPRWPRASPPRRCKTVQVAHPVLARPAGNVAIAGFVEVREERERSDRIVVRVLIARRRAARAEARARAGLGAQGHGAAGRRLCDVPRAAQSAARAAAAGRLRLRARPLFPGHRRDRLRARRDHAPRSRRRRRACGCATPPRSQGCATRIDARIRAVLPGDRGAIASALITGKRDAISAPVNDAMYISSLAHVLSISGYHMAVVAGVVFFVLRALLALVPAFASAPPDQEMGRGRRARRRGVLSCCCRARRSRPSAPSS